MGGVLQRRSRPSATTESRRWTCQWMDRYSRLGKLRYQPNGLPGDQGLIGNYKAGFWYDNSRFTDFNTVARPLPPSRGNWGFYGLFDQVLVRFGEQRSNRGFGVTGSLMVSPDQSVSQMPFFSRPASLFRGIFPSRPSDVGRLWRCFRPLQQ